MLPSRVYYWDGQSDKLEDTGERTEKIEKSGCSALPGTYTLKTVNGYSLPYREAGSTAEINPGSYMTFFSNGTWESTLYYTNTATNIDGTTNRNGSYTCSNSSGTHTNSSGVSGSFTFENGEVRVVSGSTIMIYK